ncbi:MAG: hypothetical protein JWQ03_3094 [Variovorax sp.]|nr:hypothetical protein [Variovorax sp.]
MEGAGRRRAPRGMMAGIRVMPDWLYDDLLHLSTMTTEEVKRLWDEYDGCNSPAGIDAVAIHEVLNLRGEGDYCAV